MVSMKGRSAGEPPDSAASYTRIDGSSFDKVITVYDSQAAAVEAFEND